VTRGRPAARARGGSRPGTSGSGSPSPARPGSHAVPKRVACPMMVSSCSGPP